MGAAESLACPSSVLRAKKLMGMSLFFVLMKVAEDLLRQMEEETAAAQAAGQPLAQHLSLTNIAIGTLYCSKGASGLLHWIGGGSAAAVALPFCACGTSESHSQRKRQHCGICSPHIISA